MENNSQVGFRVECRQLVSRYQNKITNASFETLVLFKVCLKFVFYSVKLGKKKHL